MKSYIYDFLLILSLIFINFEDPATSRFPASGNTSINCLDQISVFDEKLLEIPRKAHRRTLLSDFEVRNSVKIAFFDADDTLRITKSGEWYPKENPRDVVLLPNVAKKIKKLNEEGYLVAIVSNQGGVGRGIVTHGVAEQGIYNVIRLLHLHGARVDYFDFAEHLNSFRKPQTGMALHLEKVLKEINPNVEIDKSRSFMIGDAAYKDDEITPDGRYGSDFSNFDRLFASNYGIRFAEPQHYFEWISKGITRFESYEEVSQFDD